MIVLEAGDAKRLLHHLAFLTQKPTTRESSVARDDERLSAVESELACVCELCAAHSAGDASHGLPNGPRRRAATIGSMLKLQAAGGLESDSHAVSGVVSTGDPMLAAVGPPHLLAWSVALARAMRSCVCTAAVGSEPTRGCFTKSPRRRAPWLSSRALL